MSTDQYIRVRKYLARGYSATTIAQMFNADATEVSAMKRNGEFGW